ncbi:hypothetical protein [Roseivirga pacifica]|uniref:hypothetical protein n=1 Tax=Roseivirga pacifica TaxID=1267423 RepID=UPI003BB18B71
MSVVQLNFINKSNETKNNEIVIFQKNESSPNGPAVAWRVIQNCGIGDHHPFTFSSVFSVSAVDSYGNYTPRLSASMGQAFEMVLAKSGDVLRYKGAASSSNEVELENNLSTGAISAEIYRDGKLCASQRNLAPSSKAAFQFNSNIYIGAAAQIVEGQTIDAAVMSQINTEINLFGISSADIVMTGGGSGAQAKPLTFSLENIQQT